MNDASYLQKQNQQLRERLATVEAELQNKTRRMNKIQNDANSTQKQYEELLNRIIELQHNEEEIIARANENDSTKVKYQKLLLESQQKDKSLKDKEKEINELQKQVESSSIKLEAQDKIIEAKNQEINELNNNCELLQTDFTRSKQTVTDLQNELQQEKTNNQLLSAKIKSLEEVIELYKNQANSLQVINEQNQSDIIIKENEKLQLKCQELQTLIKNSTYILTNNDEELSSSTFLKLLNDKMQKPKLNSACTQSEASNQNDSMSLSSSSFIDQEMFPFFKNPITTKKKLSSDVKAQFNREKEKVKDREQKKKAEAARKLGEIKDQFQTDLSLEQIIQMHNKLWQEENQQQTFLVRKNQKCV